MNCECDICRGAGVIRLPVHARVAVSFAGPAAVTLAETARTYPCPECSKEVAAAAVMPLGSFVTVDARLPPEARQYARRDAAYLLVDELLKGKLISFTDNEDDIALTYRLRAQIGVVSRRFVATMEDRIVERQEEVAQDVVNEAQRQIAHFYTRGGDAPGTVPKAEASCAIMRAFDAVRRARKARAA